MLLEKSGESKSLSSKDVAIGMGELSSRKVEVLLDIPYED